MESKPPQAREKSTNICNPTNNGKISSDYFTNSRMPHFNSNHHGFGFLAWVSKSQNCSMDLGYAPRSNRLFLKILKNFMKFSTKSTFNCLPSLTKIV
jgi:hypothetical protein